jgi:Alginate export
LIRKFFPAPKLACSFRKHLKSAPILGFASLLLGTFALPTAHAHAQQLHAPQAPLPDTATAYSRKKGPVQPLELNHLPSWVSFYLEERGRSEEQTSLNYVPLKDRFYELTRIRGGIEVRPTSWVTGYLEFHDTHALGLPVRDVASNMHDTFDFRQGFVDFHYKSKAQLFVGRQELNFGDERVIGISNWTNNSRTFDGADLRIGDKNRVDIFTASVVTINPTSLDKHGAGLTFHGIWGNINTLLPHTSLQPFLLVHAEPHVISAQHVAGNETVVTPGIYWESKLPWHFDTSGNALFQRGSYSNDSIHAGAAITRLGYTFVNAPWQPHVTAEYKYSSGNSGRDPYHWGRYDESYPSNHNAFGLVDLFGFENIKEDRLSIAANPAKHLSVLVQGSSLHLASTHDTVYNGGSGAVFATPTGGFLTDKLGTEFDASAKYYWRKYLMTDIGVGHLFPGQVLDQAHHGAPLTLAYFQLSYRFSLNGRK